MTRELCSGPQRWRDRGWKIAIDAQQHRIDCLFDAIAHGDQEHRDWLKKAIDDHFAGRDIAPPVGKGNAELIDYLRRLLERTWIHVAKEDVELAVEVYEAFQR